MPSSLGTRFHHTIASPAYDRLARHGVTRLCLRRSILAMGRARRIGVTGFAGGDRRKRGAALSLMRVIGSHMADAQRYRDEAARRREEATRIITADIRQQMLDIAKQYEYLAKSLEENSPRRR